MTAIIDYVNATNKQREYIKNRIPSELLACQTALVMDLLEEGHEGFSIDDIENMYPDPSEWTLAECRKYLDDIGVNHPSPDPWNKDMGRDQIVELLTDVGIQCYDHEDTDTLLTALIENIDDGTIGGLEDWREAVRDNGEAQNVYEWWLVTEWLCEKLRERGEVVIDNGYGHWWGRTCTGQSALVDPTFWDIFQEALQEGCAD